MSWEDKVKQEIRRVVSVNLFNFFERWVNIRWPDWNGGSMEAKEAISVEFNGFRRRPVHLIKLFRNSYTVASSVVPKYSKRNYYASLICYY
jgi:hypothetical protein